MNRSIATALLILVIGVAPAMAQSIKILTPNDDTCAAFVDAMKTGDPAKSSELSGWALGFFAGIAQASDEDILRSETAMGILHQVYDECLKQPNRAFSLVLEEMARSLVNSHR